MRFEEIYLSHSLGLNREHIVIGAQEKIKAYIKYREDREKYLLENLKVIIVTDNLNLERTEDV